MENVFRIAKSLQGKNQDAFGEAVEFTPGMATSSSIRTASMNVAPPKRPTHSLWTSRPHTASASDLRAAATANVKNGARPKTAKKIENTKGSPLAGSTESMQKAARQENRATRAEEQARLVRNGAAKIAWQ